MLANQKIFWLASRSAPAALATPRFGLECLKHCFLAAPGIKGRLIKAGNGRVAVLIFLVI